MIVVETLTINDVPFKKTYSSLGNFIENAAGNRFAETLDLLEVETTYFETDVNIEEYAKEIMKSLGNPEQSITPEIQ